MYPSSASWPPPGAPRPSVLALKIARQPYFGWLADLVSNTDSARPIV